MVNVLKWLRPKRQNAAPAYEVASGRQQTVDTRRLMTLDRSTYWAGLNHWQRLTLFHTIYHTQELAAGAVNVLTRFANSRMVPQVDSPDVARRMRAVWEEIDGHTANGMLCRGSLVYGFCCGEWVSETMERMDKVVVPPSVEIRKVPNKQGDILSYLQLPGWTWGAPTSIDGRRAIPPAKVIDVIRDPENSFDYYGNSLFETAIDQFESLAQIMDAQIRVYMRMGKPRFHVAINAEGLTPEQFQDRLDKTKAVFAQLGDLDSSDIYTPAGVDVKIIGAESFGQRFADETRLVVSNILAAVGIPPALLHVTIQGAVGTESYARQSIIAMQTMIDEIQRSLAAAWNRSFWPMVARLEGWAETPKIGFEKPRLLEQLQEEQARDLRWTNDLREVTYGIRPAEWLVQRCGASDPDDPAALARMVAQARERPEPQPQKPDATKAGSTTKGTDGKATNNTSL